MGNHKNICRLQDTVYRAAVLSLEKDFLKEINSVLYEFLWKGKDKVKRTAVITERHSR